MELLVSAIFSGRKEIVEILLEAGMDPNSFDTDTGFPIEIKWLPTCSCHNIFCHAYTYTFS